jgi:hypothetical protein
MIGTTPVLPEAIPYHTIQSLIKERKKERKSTVALSNRVDADLYQAWSTLYSGYGQKSRRLEELFARDVLEAAKSGKAVVIQNLTQFIKVEPHATINLQINAVNAKTQTLVVKYSTHKAAVEWADHCCRHMKPHDHDSVKHNLSSRLEKDTTLVEEQAIKALMARLEMTT